MSDDISYTEDSVNDFEERKLTERKPGGGLAGVRFCQECNATCGANEQCWIGHGRWELFVPMVKTPSMKSSSWLRSMS